MGSPSVSTMSLSARVVPESAAAAQNGVIIRSRAHNDIRVIGNDVLLTTGASGWRRGSNCSRATRTSDP